MNGCIELVCSLKYKSERYYNEIKSSVDRKYIYEVTELIILSPSQKFFF